jgi:hypothetical protein
MGLISFWLGIYSTVERSLPSTAQNLAVLLPGRLLRTLPRNFRQSVSYAGAVLMDFKDAVLTIDRLGRFGYSGMSRSLRRMCVVNFQASQALSKPNSELRRLNDRSICPPQFPKHITFKFRLGSGES